MRTIHHQISTFGTSFWASKCREKKQTHPGAVPLSHFDVSGDAIAHKREGCEYFAADVGILNTAFSVIGGKDEMLVRGRMRLNVLEKVILSNCHLKIIPLTNPPTPAMPAMLIFISLLVLLFPTIFS